jgi:hypothetical protein
MATYVAISSPRTLWSPCRRTGQPVPNLSGSDGLAFFWKVALDVAPAGRADFWFVPVGIVPGSYGVTGTGSSCSAWAW